MREELERSATARLPKWQAENDRLRKLAIFELHLSGKIYEHLPYEFHQESKPGVHSTPTQIPQSQRKPATRLRHARTCAVNIARKLFAGRHAPSLVHESKPNVVKQIQKLLDEASVGKEMIGLVIKGSVGSVCATFKIVEVDKKQTLVLNVFKSIDCFPSFDAAKQLRKLMIAYATDGAWFKQHDIHKDYKGDAVEPKHKYWHVMELDKNHESYFYPIKLKDWDPVNGAPAKLVLIKDDGPLTQVTHKLGFVPAHWFSNLTDGEFPDGGCLFEPALDNIVTYDYEMSGLDHGIKNAACPVTVIKGNLVQATDAEGNVLPRPASRYLHFEAGIKDPDGVTEESGDAKLIETTGQGFIAGLALLRQIKKDINEQTSSSRKDPDKVTTAMSGKGIELIEEEFMDLVFELRTSYGEDGYLKLVKKMVRAAIQVKHPLAKGVTEEDLEELNLAWPDLHDMSPQEYQQLTTGIIQAQENGIMDPQQAKDLHRAKVDVPTSHANSSKSKTLTKSTSKKSKENS